MRSTIALTFAISLALTVSGRQNDVSGIEKNLLDAAKSDKLPASLPALENLAVLYRRSDRRAEEADICSRIIKIWSRAAGKDSPAVARFLAQRAEAEAAAGLTTSAENSFRDSLAILKKKDLQRTVFGYVVLASHAKYLLSQGRTNEATTSFNDAIDGLDSLMGRVSPWLIEQLGAAFSTAYSARHPGEPVLLRPPEPVPLSNSYPAYPNSARDARVSGQVSMIIEVTAEGRVGNMWIFRPLDLGLDRNAMETVRQWRFRPAMQNGIASRTTVIVDLNFSLR